MIKIHAMKTFKDLILKSKKSQALKDILQAVISELPANWKLREDLIENYAKNVSKEKSEIGCFESSIIDKKKDLYGLLFGIMN